MGRPRCPGQNTQFWKPDDIFNINCPYCDGEIEFWKDEPMLNCPKCGREVRNPRIDLGCAKWCKFAQECLGTLPDELDRAAPVVERLIKLMEKHLVSQPGRLKRAREVHALTERILAEDSGDPRVVKCASLIAGASLNEDWDVLEKPTLPKDNPFCDPHSPREILAEAGLDPAAIEQICTIADAVLSERILEGGEFAIVWDVIQLERLSLINEAAQPALEPAVIMATLRTESGKELARKHYGSGEGS